MSVIKRNDIKAFTLIEIMVVVLIVGIIAAFALPNYSKSVRKARERDMELQLRTIHAANNILEAQQGTYWNTAAADVTNLNTINNTLGINIIATDGTTYTYNSADGSAFTATASWDNFSVRVNDGALDGTNLCCSAGTCPSVSNC